jgi:hypothetical protein
MQVRRNSEGVIINANELVVDEVVGDRVLCPACHNKVWMLTLLIDASAFLAVPMRNAKPNSSASGLGYFVDLLWHIEYTKQSFAR